MNLLRAAIRHYFIAVGASVSNENCLFFVVWTHKYLVVPRESVHEGQQFMFSRGFDQSVNMRAWEAVFRTCFIQIRNVNAYPALPVFLFNYDWVSKLIGVFYFPYRSDFEQPVDLIVYSFGPFETQLAMFLFYRPVRINVQFVRGYVEAYSSEVRA